MAPSDPSPVSAELPRPRLRLPHWGWLLLATVALVIGFVGLSVWLPWHREQQVLQDVELWGGTVESRTFSPLWLERFLSRDRMRELKIFDRAIIVELPGIEIGDTQIAELTKLTRLDLLDLNKTLITDAGLRDFRRFAKLRDLSLGGTKVTDTGLAQLSKLTNLEFLCLDGTVVTDAGLDHLSNLSSLRQVHVGKTHVTRKGVEAFKTMLPRCHVFYR
jgi:hypothetical protein